jgi:hypothetical protein
MRAVAQAYRGRGAADFFHRDDMSEIPHFGAAIGLGDGNAEQTHFTELGPELVGELVAAIDFGRQRRDFGLREILHRVAQHVDGFTEIEVEGGNMYHGCLQVLTVA